MRKNPKLISVFIEIVTKNEFSNRYLYISIVVGKKKKKGGEGRMRMLIY